MAIVYDWKDKKEVEVRNLKNVKFSSVPEYQFFVHKSLRGKGYALTEKISGTAVVAKCETVKSVIEWSENIIKHVGKSGLDKAVAQAILKKHGLIDKDIISVEVPTSVFNTPSKS
jgi:hypothetical protein